MISIIIGSYSIIFGAMKFVSKAAGFLLLLPVYLYRGVISPLTPASCRHTPTCSQYAIDAVRRTGPLRGLILGTNRFLRCRPGGTWGYDPAPLIWIRRYRPINTVTGRWKRCNRLKN